MIFNECSAQLLRSLFSHLNSGEKKGGERVILLQCFAQLLCYSITYIQKKTFSLIKKVCINTGEIKCGQRMIVEKCIAQLSCSFLSEIIGSELENGQRLIVEECFAELLHFSICSKKSMTIGQIQLGEGEVIELELEKEL